MKVQISTDGSGTSKGAGGWAAVIRFKEEYREICGSEPEATNNRMELMAVIQALRYLKRPCQVELTTDSEYVKQGITERLPKWKRYGWTTVDGQPVKNRDLWEQIDAEVRRHSSVEILWTPGHADHVDNCRADVLAGAERRKLLGEPEPKKRGPKKIFNLDKATDEAIQKALSELPEELFFRLQAALWEFERRHAAGDRPRETDQAGELAGGK